MSFDFENPHQPTPFRRVAAISTRDQSDNSYLNLIKQFDNSHLNLIKQSNNMSFNKELNNNKLISVNLKFTESFIVTSQLDSTKLTRSTKTKSLRIIKIFLHLAILKQKQKGYDINLEKLSIKTLRAALLTMFANKNSKILQNSITKDVLIF